MIGAAFRYLVFLPFNILFVLLAFILSPFLALISMATGPRLPGILQWFSTLDGDLDAGAVQHPEIYDANASGLKLWWQRTSWICRNPSHGWQAKVLGFKAAGAIEVSSSATTNGPYFTTKIIWKDANGRTYFSYRADKKLFGGYYLKVYFGWALTAYDGESHHYEFQPLMVKKLS